MLYVDKNLDNDKYVARKASSAPTRLAQRGCFFSDNDSYFSDFHHITFCIVIFRVVTGNIFRSCLLYLENSKTRVAPTASFPRLWGCISDATTVEGSRELCEVTAIPTKGS
jgi:hypothetical protein